MTSPIILPPSSDKRWVDIVTGKITPEWSILATKILMFRIVSLTKVDSSENNIKKCIQEVRTFMEKNIDIVKPDVVKVFK